MPIAMVSASLLLLAFVLVPIFLILVVSVGAAMLRAACVLAQKIVGSGLTTSTRTAPSSEVQIVNPSPAHHVVEANPFSSPSAYTNPDTHHNPDDLNPSFGTALVIVFLVMVSSLIGGLCLSFLVRFAFATANPLNPMSPTVEWLLQSVVFFIPFLMMCLFGRLILKTTWIRATLVSVLWHLIGLVLALAIATSVFVVLNLLR